MSEKTTKKRSKRSKRSIDAVLRALGCDFVVDGLSDVRSALQNAAPLYAELLSQFLSRHRHRLGPCMIDILVGWVVHAADRSKHDLTPVGKFEHLQWDGEDGMKYTVRGLWANVMWEELRWAVGAFDAFVGMRPDEREFFRMCLEEFWCVEDLFAEGVTVPPGADDGPPEKAVDLKDVPEGVVPLGWALMRKIQQDGDVGKPSAELADTAWTAAELGVMSRLVDTPSERLEWLGMTKEQYDEAAAAEEPEENEKGKGEQVTAQRNSKGKGKEKAEEQEKGQGKRMKETPKRTGAEKRARFAEVKSGPGESSAGEQKRASKGAGSEARIRELESARAGAEARISQLESRNGQLEAAAAEWQRKFKGKAHEMDQQDREIRVLKTQLKQKERASRRS